MSAPHIILLAVALGADAMSVALALGHQITSGRQVFRLTWHFGLFQFLMPLLGVALGTGLAGLAGVYAPWAAFALLAMIGGRMIAGGLRNRPTRIETGMRAADPTRGMMLVWLSLATSMDALGVGLSLGLVSGSLLVPALVIGLTASAMTFIGIRLGRIVGMALGRWAELAGGVLLVGIGLNMILG